MGALQAAKVLDQFGDLAGGGDDWISVASGILLPRTSPDHFPRFIDQQFVVTPKKSGL